MDSIFYSNFGGSAIRYDKAPGALGMLEPPDNPLPIGIALRIEWAEPRAWRCSGSRSTRRIFPGGGALEAGRDPGADPLAVEGQGEPSQSPQGDLAGDPDRPRTARDRRVQARP